MNRQWGLGIPRGRALTFHSSRRDTLGDLLCKLGSLVVNVHGGTTMAPSTSVPTGGIRNLLLDPHSEGPMHQIFLYHSTAQTPNATSEALCLDELSALGVEGVSPCALLALPGRDPKDQGVVLVCCYTQGRDTDRECHIGQLNGRTLAGRKGDILVPSSLAGRPERIAASLHGRGEGGIEGVHVSEGCPC